MPESRGGGSISGHGVVDLGLIAYEFGRHAAPGPLTITNVVAETLGADASGAHAEVVAGVLDGSDVVSWCFTERRPHQRLGDIALGDPERRRRAGAQRSQASGRIGPFSRSPAGGPVGLATGSGQVLVPTDTAGVTVTPLEGVDLTRRFDEVRFDDVRVPQEAAVGELGAAESTVERQLEVAVVMAAAESVGAMQAAFDMTLAYSFDRYSFGRPIASYQALKHRFADMKTGLEASHAITDAAIDAVSRGAPEAPALASAATAFVGDTCGELLQDCVQLHGGIGMTYEHDLHLFLRRHTQNRTLHGLPTEHRQRIAAMVAEREAVS